VLISTVMIDYVMVFLPPYTRESPAGRPVWRRVVRGRRRTDFFPWFTTGGADIVVKMILRKYPHFSTGKIILALKRRGAAQCRYGYQNIETALYGLFMTFASGKVVEPCCTALMWTQFVFVISHRNEEIAEAIIAHMHGAPRSSAPPEPITHAQRRCFYCVVRKQELYRLKKNWWNRWIPMLSSSSPSGRDPRQGL
jgi:hypothetical protein